jgi:hypothetical protein
MHHFLLEKNWLQNAIGIQVSLLSNIHCLPFLAREQFKPLDPKGFLFQK